MRLGVLVSGGGTNLQAILDACASGALAAEVALVISDRPEVRALERAAAARVPSQVLRLADHRDRDAYSAAIAEALGRARVDLVVLAGFLKILTAPFVRAFSGRVINTHPALLPAFGGPGMHGLAVHQAVLDWGCRVSGCTVHFVDDSVDGGPIIEQVAVPVLASDSAELLQARILGHEHRALVRVLRWLAAGQVSVDGRRVTVPANEQEYE